MTWKNRLLIGIVRFFQTFLNENRDPDRILVVSTTGLGDSLWATPALEAIKTSFPKSTISLLTSPVGEEILRHNPAINRVIVLKEPVLHRLIGLWRILRREKIGTVLLFHASQRLTLPLVSCIGAKTIVGTEGINKGLDSLLTCRLKNTHKHEIVRRLEIGEKIGAKRTKETLSIHLLPEEMNSYPKLPQGNWIAIHPGSKDGFKRWPAEHFGLVGRRLQQKGFRILITGSPGERPLMEHVAAHIPDAELSDPTLSLRAFASQLSQVKLLISNDTGPVHIACGLNIPVIGLYSATDPSLCGPHHAAQASVISKPPSCQPCLKKSCRLPFCMLQIGPEEVVKTAIQILNTCT